MNIVRKLLLAIRFIGLGGVLRSIRYALRRDRMDRKDHGLPSSHGSELRPEEIVSFSGSPRGGQFSFHDGLHLQVEFGRPDAVTLTWEPGTLPYTAYGYGEGLDGENLNIEIMATRINSSDNHLPEGGTLQKVSFKTHQLNLTVWSDGRTELRGAEHNLLAHFEPPTLNQSAWRLTFPLAPREHIYGLGQRASGLDLVGRRYEFWNSSPGGSYGEHVDPLYLTLPVYIGLHAAGSYLVFFENTHKGSLDLRGEQGLVSFCAGALKLHLVAGAPPTLVERYTELTGRPELPPRWSLGFHQCRWGYQSSDDLRNIVRGFEENKLPLHALHQDIDYMDGYRVFTIDRFRYPDLQSLTEELAMRNIRLITILDPGVKVDPNFPVYQTGLARAAFVRTPEDSGPAVSPVWPGWCVFPDFTANSVREWWGDQYPALLDQGVTGFWHDMNEPETFAAWGDCALPDRSLHSFDGRNGTHLEGRNIYGLLMNQAGYQAMRRHRPEQRPWLLSRSGWAGSQRYAWHWTADIESTWDALRISVFMVINLGLSGFAYTGTDIGGFTGNPSAELFTRWFQLAALHPFFRNHAVRGTKPREPWVYEEPTTSIIRDILRLREKLLPYLYTLAAECTATGAPFVRPLFWANPERQELWDVDDVFLLGDDLLVVPVLEPGVKNRTFSVPPGVWHDLWTDQALPEDRPAVTAVTIERIPIFVRGGAILPLEIEPDILELHVFPDEAGAAAGRLYYDKGDGYEPGGEAQISFQREFGTVEVTLSDSAEFPWGTVIPVARGSLAGSEVAIRISRGLETGQSD